MIASRSLGSVFKLAAIELPSIVFSCDIHVTAGEKNSVYFQCDIAAILWCL
jgi:hypothetical protein